MGATVRRWVLVVTAVIVATGSLVPSSHAAAERVDQACVHPPAEFDSIASYTVAQSFSPESKQIDSWEAGIWLITGAPVTLRSRLVFQPTGDSGVELAMPSVQVLAESTVQVRDRRQYRLTWVRFKPPSPIVLPAMPVKVRASFAIEIDFPLNPSVPSGADMSWYSCGDRYDGGRAWVVTNPEGVNRQAKLGLSSAPTQPGVRRAYSRAENLMFRVYGR